MVLDAYNQKRDFAATPEPEGELDTSNARRFVVQEHHASRLHFDFRLEIGGVLKSWAVPKGPSLNPSDKRLAVMTEDHPVKYLHFQGRIAEGNHGAGEMVIWDSGTFEPVDADDPGQAVEHGRFRLRLAGKKLQGEFSLMRLQRGDNQWLLIKSKDEFANPDWEMKTILPAQEKAPSKRVKRKTVDTAATPKAAAPKRSSQQGAPTKTVPVEKAFRARSLEGDVVVEVENEVVTLTNLDKIYWPDEGYTKGDLLRYYYTVSSHILPYLQARPLILKRYPNGIKGHSFFQHNVEDPPKYITTLTEEVEGDIVHYAVCNNLASLLYLVNLGNIAKNPWHSSMDNPEHATWIVFDLDPEEGQFDKTCAVALALKELLDSVHLTSYPKTSGASGLHVYVPIKPVYSYEDVAQFVERAATIISQQNPELVTIERALKQRKQGTVYLDYLQNAQGKTVVSPYSVRARAGATVSAPLEWQEVKKCLQPQEFTIKNMPQRIKKKGDLFEAVLNTPQVLDNAIQQIDQLWQEVRGKKRTGR